MSRNKTNKTHRNRSTDKSVRSSQSIRVSMCPIFSIDSCLDVPSVSTTTSLLSRNSYRIALPSLFSCLGYQYPVSASISRRTADTIDFDITSAVYYLLLSLAQFHRLKVCTPLSGEPSECCRGHPILIQAFHLFEIFVSSFVTRRGLQFDIPIGITTAITVYYFLTCTTQLTAGVCLAS